MPLESLGKMLVVLGLVIAALGALFMLGGRLPFIGNLPGDIAIERDNVKIYLPIATSIVLSVLVTIVLNLLFGLLNRP